MRIDLERVKPDPDLDRTLYLTEKKGLVVKRDGPSIWIKEKGSAGRRIPARFVNMVVVIGNIMLDTGLVALFCENDVPVMFMNVRCEEVAVASPARRMASECRNVQEYLLESTERIASYRAWARSKRRRTAHLVRSFYADRKEGPFAMAWRDISQMEQTIAYARREHSLAFGVAFGIVDGLVREMIVSILQKARLDPHTGIMHRNTQFGFARDISFMAGSETEAQSAAFAFSAREEDFLVNGSRSRIPSREGMKKIIEAFEERKAALAGHVDDILSSYARFARGLP